MVKIDNEIVKKIDKIHPYPAKYTVEIIEEFIEKYTKEGDIVLDPFVGSGTTLLASSVKNRIGIGTDINPIAYLISKYKLIDLDQEEVKKLEIFLNDLKAFLIEKNFFNGRIENEKKSFYSEIMIEKIHYPSIEHWFKDFVIETLSAIRTFINYSFKTNERLRDFCFTAFSGIIVTVSNQESNTRYVAVEKEKLSISFVYEQFAIKLKSFIKASSSIERDKKILEKSNVFLKNSKLLDTFIKEKCDFLITSPPYPNTYDYYLYHKHRMLWLGYDYQPVMEQEIGSRREFSSLKRPKENFIKDLFEIFQSCDSILKKGAYILIIIGDGQIRGEFYDSLIATKKVGEMLEWQYENSDHTFLDETSKSFMQSFRTKGKKEHYILFKKIK